MNNDLISRNDLIDAKPEFLNEKVVRDTKYQTTKERIYAKAWNACNSCWIDTIDNAPTVERPQDNLIRSLTELCNRYCKNCPVTGGEPNGNDCTDCICTHIRGIIESKEE